MAVFRFRSGTARLVSRAAFLGFSTIALAPACSRNQAPPPMPAAAPDPQPPRASATAVTSAQGAAEAVPGAPIASAPARAAKAPFGSLEGKNVELYTLTNSEGMVAKIATYGATLTELHVPDRSGKLADVVLGFDSLDEYRKHAHFFGASVGRVANRIRDGRFKLAGKEYQLATNDPPHHLHGGKRGFDKVIWNAEALDSPDGPSLRLTYVSADGEEGYPGRVTAHTVFTLTERNELRVDLEAATDKTTLVNLAQHSYWNLGGHTSGSIEGHLLELYADAYTPGDPMVPTGAVKPVKGTAFDFTAAKPLGRDLRATGLEPRGYDHNFVVSGDPDSLRPVARLTEPKSGRVMTLEANQPGVQLYTGNFLNGVAGKGGAVYAQHTGLCLETQKFPNAINVPAWRKQVILEPGQPYRHTMVLRFSAE